MDVAYPVSMDIPADLVAQQANGLLVPFLGHTMARRVLRRGTPEPLFPTWPELLAQGAMLVEPDYRRRVERMLAAQPANLGEAARQLRVLMGQPRWNRFLKEKFYRDYSEADGASLKLAAAVWQLDPKVVVTTGYDRSPAWACPEPRQRDLQVVGLETGIDVSTITSATPDRPVLWYLNGRAEFPGSLVLAPGGRDPFPNSDGEEVRKRVEQARVCFDYLAASHSLLFVGWTASDEHLIDDLIRVQRLFDNFTVQHYVLCPEPEAGGVREFLRHRELTATVVSVPASAESMAEALTRISQPPHVRVDPAPVPRVAKMRERPLRRRCRTVPVELAHVNPGLVRAFSECRRSDDQSLALRAARRSSSSLTVALCQATVFEFDGAIELASVELGHVSFLGIEEGYRRLFHGMASEKLNRLDEAIADCDWISRNIDSDEELLTCSAFNRMICMEKLGEDGSVAFGDWLADRDRRLRTGDLLWTKAFNMELVAARRARRTTPFEDLLPDALLAEQDDCAAGCAKTFVNWTLYSGTQLREEDAYRLLSVANAHPVNAASGLLHHCLLVARRVGDRLLEESITRCFEAYLARSRSSDTVSRFIE